MALDLTDELQKLCDMQRAELVSLRAERDALREAAMQACRSMYFHMIHASPWGAACVERLEKAIGARPCGGEQS